MEIEIIFFFNALEFRFEESFNEVVLLLINLKICVTCAYC